jgi:hypothetical protein
MTNSFGRFFAALTLLVAALPAWAALENKITIANKSGAPVTNYPLQFGRPFLQGEIKQCAELVAGETPIATQTDAKNRYGDGSLKQAVIAAVLPSIPAGGSVTLTFRDQPCSTEALSKEALLKAFPDFDATMQLVFTSGMTGVASARAILENGDCKPWTSGPIAQTMECADDTAARKYDLGNGDGFRPFRPRFYATFWPTINKAQVRFVGENGLTTELEDLRYNLALALGHASPQPVYSIDLTGGTSSGGKAHWAMTNWTKRFWVGGVPEQKINVNHGLSYLRETKYIPNFDDSLIIPEADLARNYRRWVERPKEIGDPGPLVTGMGTPGHRDEIGPYPTWSVALLYTGDHRMREMALGMADLAGAWPANLRESDPARNLLRSDPPGAGTGLGKAISISNRPTTSFASGLAYAYTKPADRVTLVGPVTLKWGFDGAHQPAPFYVEYVLTGDPYYLNQMYNWAAFSAARYNGAASPTAVYGRGPTGAEGVILDEPRGAGWVIRSRAEAAHAAPDSDPMKAYLTTLISDALARWEGGFKITGTSLDGDPSKVWGLSKGNTYTNKNGPFATQAPTLHGWDSAGDPRSPAGNSSITTNEKNGIWQVGKVGSITSTWMHHFILYGLGRAAELGFPAGPMFEYSVENLIGMILDSGNPLLAGAYQTPVERAGGGFMSWAEILQDGFTASFLTGTGAADLPAYVKGQLVPDNGRIFWAVPATAYAIDFGVPRAAETRAWFKVNVIDKVPNLNTNPKWAIVPRGSVVLLR